MSVDAASLASLSTALTDLAERVSAIAAAHASGDDEQLSADLFEVERALQGAQRRLERTLRARR